MRQRKRAIGAIYAAVLVTLAAVVGCGLPEGARSADNAKRMDVHAVEWNPTHADVGHAEGLLLIDDSGVVVVFAGETATIIDAGAVDAVDTHSAAWRGATVIPAPDGTGEWIVTVDVRNVDCFLLLGRKRFDPIASRFGVEAGQVEAMTGAGDGLVGVGLAGGKLAIADGTKVTGYGGAPAIKALVSGVGKIAALTTDGIWVVDGAAKAPTTFHLEGAEYIAIDGSGRLYAATDDAVYAAQDDGTLHLRFASSDSAIHGLVRSKGRIWFADGTELGDVIDADVARTRDAHVAPHARIFGSESGDVWTIDDHGAVARWAFGSNDAAPAAWASTAAPVFARVCSSCHAAKGSSGIDLSSEATWVAKRDKIRERVLEKRDMPPRGTVLSEADRLAIERFAKSGR